jgi:hypothetical protein
MVDSARAEVLAVEEKLERVEADLARREAAFELAMSKNEELQAKLAAAEQQATALHEARELAVKLKAERDEARNVARQLHLKIKGT